MQCSTLINQFPKIKQSKSCSSTGAVIRVVGTLVLTKVVWSPAIDDFESFNLGGKS